MTNRSENAPAFMDTNQPEIEREEAIRRHNEGLMAAVLNHAKPTPTTEEKLRGAIIEALFYLDNNSPPTAHGVLRRALKI